MAESVNEWKQGPQALERADKREIKKVINSTPYNEVLFWRGGILTLSWLGKVNWPFFRRLQTCTNEKYTKKSLNELKHK